VHRATSNELPRYLSLAAVVVLIWCVYYGRFTAKAWNTPLDYYGDALAFNVAPAKAAADGYYFPLASKIVPTLGAPRQANWNDFPFTEDTIFFLEGMAARVIGLFAAVNLSSLVAHVLAAFSFYYVCRWLKYNWQLSMAAALIFAFSTYMCIRNVAHIGLSYYWVVPLDLLVCWWAGSRHGLRLGSRRFWSAVAIAGVTGIHNAYYTCIFLQFLSFAALFQFAQKSARSSIMGPLAVGLVTFLSFLSMHIDTLAYSATHGTHLAFQRTLADLEVYSLNPVQLLIPSDLHRWPIFRSMGKAYADGTTMAGEFPACYVGAVGAFTLMWLALQTIRSVFRSTAKPIAVHALQIIWIILFGCCGGINELLGLAGCCLFRCTNRFSIVILALLLFFLVQQLSKRWGQWNPWRRAFLCLFLSGFALMDQMPRLWNGFAIETIHPIVASDAAFVNELERRLPAGAMIFQLPVADFPAGWDVRRKFNPCEQFRPYVVSHRLRFSYGDDKGREQEFWQQQIVSLPPDEMVRLLQEYGFSAICINRNGYKDHAERLIGDLRSDTRSSMINSDLNDLCCIFITRSVKPTLPPLGPAFYGKWYEPESDEAGHRWRWSYGSSSLEIDNSAGRSAQQELSFQLVSTVPREVRISFNGRPISANLVAPTRPLSVSHLVLTLHDGINSLSFDTDVPATRASEKDPRYICFGLLDLHLASMEAVAKSCQQHTSQ
jgi:hypothetical protein